MKKNSKIKRVFQQNNIERDNFTLVLRLKQKVEELNATIQAQQDVIGSFKRDVKTTKINEMEIQIQHLQDQNLRLVHLVDHLKASHTRHSPSSLTTNLNDGTLGVYSSLQSFDPLNKKSRLDVINGKSTTKESQWRWDGKVGQVLRENQQLKKQLMGLKVNETMLKKRKSLINDRSNMFIQKKLVDYERVVQKKLQAEAENTLMKSNIKRLQTRVRQLEQKNQELALTQQFHPHR